MKSIPKIMSLTGMLSSLRDRGAAAVMVEAGAVAATAAEAATAACTAVAVAAVMAADAAVMVEAGTVAATAADAAETEEIKEAAGEEGKSPFILFLLLIFIVGSVI